VASSAKLASVEHRIVTTMAKLLQKNSSPVDGDSGRVAELAKEEMHRIVAKMVKLRRKNSSSVPGDGAAELASEEHRIGKIIVKLRRKDSIARPAAEHRIILLPLVATAEVRPCTSRLDQ